MCYLLLGVSALLKLPLYYLLVKGLGLCRGESGSTISSNSGLTGIGSLILSTIEQMLGVFSTLMRLCSASLL